MILNNQIYHYYLFHSFTQCISPANNYSVSASWFFSLSWCFLGFWFILSTEGSRFICFWGYLYWNLNQLQVPSVLLLTSPVKQTYLLRLLVRNCRLFKYLFLTHIQCKVRSDGYPFCKPKLVKILIFWKAVLDQCLWCISGLRYFKLTLPAALFSSHLLSVHYRAALSLTIKGTNIFPNDVYLYDGYFFWAAVHSACRCDRHCGAALPWSCYVTWKFPTSVALDFTGQPRLIPSDDLPECWRKLAVWKASTKKADLLILDIITKAQDVLQDQQYPRKYWMFSSHIFFRYYYISWHA